MDFRFSLIRTGKHPWYHYGRTGKGITFCLHTLWPRNRYKLFKTMIKLSDVDKNLHKVYFEYRNSYIFSNANLYSIFVMSRLIQTHWYHHWWLIHEGFIYGTFMDKSIQKYIIIVFTASYLPGILTKISVKCMIFIRRRYFTKGKKIKVEIHWKRQLFR